jgi:Recombination directionality factor-like
MSGQIASRGARLSDLATVQAAHAEVGRIRLGEKRDTGKIKDGKRVYAPQRRAEFRFTSPSRAYIIKAQMVYGGEIREWRPSETAGQQWELLSEAKEVEVVVPPGEAVQQYWELWDGPVRRRQCAGAGTAEILSGQPCKCPVDLAARAMLAGQRTPTACKPHTRLRVMLPDVSIGVWRVESSGRQAAEELPEIHDMIRIASESGVHVPALLGIEQRKSVSVEGTRQWVVPILRPLPSFRELVALGKGEQPAGLGDMLALSARHMAKLGIGTRIALPGASPAARAAAPPTVSPEVHADEPPDDRWEPPADDDDIVDAEVVEEKWTLATANEAWHFAVLAESATNERDITAIGGKARELGYLSDVVDGPDGESMTLNQILRIHLGRVRAAAAAAERNSQ